MTPQQAQQIIILLESKGVAVANGLTNKEIFEIETKFNFKFPPDLKVILQQGLPSGDNFPDWRQALSDQLMAREIIEWLDQPFRGILFDIEHNDYWNETWEPRTGDLKENLEIAKRHFKYYSKLIPIFAHRYISSEPNEEGNPVYSVHQTDIIYYGYDLPTYFANEFHFALPETFNIPEQPKRIISFWSELTE